MVMKREHQWDMFDVAVGACDLEQYLNQRYSENDLQSKFWVETSDSVDELRPAQDGSKEQVVIPVQRPSTAKATEVPSALQLPSRPSWETTSSSASAALSEAKPPSRFSSTYLTPAAQPSPAHFTPDPSPAALESPNAKDYRLPKEASMSTKDRVDPASKPSGDDLAKLNLQHERAISDKIKEDPPKTLTPPSMSELLARFHEATKAYEERATDLGDLVEPASDEPSGE